MTIERPILFSAPMVRAINAGIKTQTRRILKRQPWQQPEQTADGRWQLFAGDEPFAPFDCPYGKPGERLWVRETFRGAKGYDGQPPSKWGNKPIWYTADGEPSAKWWHLSDRNRPGIHMPRWASRITLEITGVRVERLQDIREADAMAEGVRCDNGEGGPYYFVPGVGYGGSSESAVLAYRRLWESINGAGSWALNPWVWVLEFKRVEGK